MPEIQLVDILQELGEGDNDDPSDTPEIRKEKICKKRKAICKIINSLLLDLDKVADDITKHGKSPATEVVLPFIGYCTATFPQVFVATSPLGSETPALSQMKSEEVCREEQLCHSFTLWIIERLLCILGHPSCTVLHDKALSALISIFKLLRWKEPHAFLILISELISCLGDLALLYDQFCDDCVVLESTIIKRFSPACPTGAAAAKTNVDDIEMCQKPVIVSTPESCELLQIAITSIFMTNLTEACQSAVAGAKVDLLWGAIGCQVEYGAPNVKKVSLDAMTMLLKYVGLPSPQPLDYAVSCLEGMIDFIVEEQGMFGSTTDGLEESWCSCFSQFFIANKGFGSSNNLELYHFEQMLVSLTSAVARHRPEKLSNELMAKMCTLVMKVWKEMPASVIQSPSLKEIRSKWSSQLCFEIGMLTTAQFLVPCVWFELDLELEDKFCSQEDLFAKSDVDPQSSVAGGVLYQELLRKRTFVLTQLMNLGQNDGSSVSRMVEGLRVITEVLSMALLSKHAKNVLALSPGFASEEFLVTLCDVFRSTLRFLAAEQMQAEHVAQIYSQIVRTMGAILVVGDVMKSTPDLWLDFSWMLTLQWLPNDISWLDLKRNDSKEIAQLATVLADKLSPQSLCDCVSVLGLMPKEVCPQWRSKVMQSALNDSDKGLKCWSIHCFPTLLYYYGPNGNHLVYDLLHHLVKETCTKVSCELAQIYGPLACVVSRKAVLQSPAGPDFSRPLYELMELKCTSCDPLPDNDKSGRPRLVDPGMFLPFLHLLKLEEKQVRLGIVGSLKRVFGHIELRANNTATVDMMNKCLCLIEDSDYNVRLAFSEIMQNLVSDSRSDKASETDEAIINKLKEVKMLAIDNSNHRLQETVLITIGQLGKSSQGHLLIMSIICLLESLISTTPFVAAVANQQIQAVAKHKEMTMQQLFMQFRMQICSVFAELMYEVQSRADSKMKKPKKILEALANVFDFADVESFLKRTYEKYFIPYLVSKANATTSQLIKIIAKTLHVNYAKVLISSTKYTFCYLVRTCGQQDLDTALQYLQTETKVQLQSLFRLDCQKLQNELLLYLGTHYNEVFNALKMLAKTEDKLVNTTEEMADFLQPRLLGILASFDTHFLTNSVPFPEKRMALKSLTAIMTLMGTKHITTVRVKVMTTLRIGLGFKDKDIPEVCCKAWNTFVRSVHISSLGPMLSQIVVTLIPLLNKLPIQVATIFNFLIIENRRALKQHFHELYFMPDIPELADVNALLKKCQEGQQSSSLKTQMSHLLKGVGHESPDVRMHALTKLKQLLHTNQSAIREMVLGNELADPMVSQIAGALLGGCRESDSKIRCLSGECLGELGAIDPGRLDLKTNNPKEEQAKFHASVNDSNFAFDLINELARAFLAAEDARTQDCSALAIQELLQIYEVSSTEEGSPGSRLWNRFPEHVQEILSPLLMSRYILSTTSDWSTLPHPIYHSKKGNNFNDWVCTWTGYLISKVAADKPMRVFQSCSAAIKYNAHLALYLLPHVLIHALLDGTPEENEIITQEILEVLSHVKKADTILGSVSDFRHLSAQTVFSVLDHLTKWIRHRIQTLSSTGSRSSRDTPQSCPSYIDDAEYKTIKNFLEKIPQDLLAAASYNCKAYTRALMHIEQFIKLENQSVQDNLDFIQKIYVAMDEPDGVRGVTAACQQQLTLHEQILAHESIGQLQDATACYEQVIQLEPDKITHHQGLLKCLMDLGQTTTALYHVNGILADWPEWSNQLNAFRIEAAWKLSNWDSLDGYLKKEHSSANWNVHLSKIFLAARSRDVGSFMKQLEIARCDQMGPLSAASMESGSYQRGYEYIVRLHILNEIEKGVHSLLHRGRWPGTDNEILSPLTKNQLLSQWESRLSLVQSSFRSLEPILIIRRVLMSLGQECIDYSLDKEIGRCFLQSARVARKAGHNQTAYSSLLKASEFNLPEFVAEKAKWLWQRGDNDGAQSFLEKGVKTHYSDLERIRAEVDPDKKKEEELSYAKTLLLLAIYSEETACVAVNPLMRKYMDVMDVKPDWEAGYFHLAKYYDKVMHTMPDLTDEKKAQCLGPITLNFGKSLMYGNEYIYQSMPRMLSLWLDNSAKFLEEKAKMPKNTPAMNAIKAHHEKANKMLEDFSTKLPAYQFLTALPQLVSRICHADAGVFYIIVEIVKKVLVQYPQQAMWLMMAVSKSSYPIRMKRCQEIFSQAKQMDSKLDRFLMDATKLVDRLLDLCNKKVEGNIVTISMAQHFRTLKRLVEDNRFSRILVPLQSALTVTLPSTPGSHAEHDAFPEQNVYISGFEDTVEILPSLQKPKKITMRGSDGKLYIMMCKPKDDLRKDCRLMEFNGIVNKCLRKDPESRRRQLHIRTYAVVPLNEECGLIEWVSHTQGFRNIIIKIYKERRIYCTAPELKKMQPALQASEETKLNIFNTKMLPRHPSVFHEWFMRTFPDPTSWYMARLSYARTAAVMSMVGYILGLGDRHGENILMDSTNGDVLHVDFNCLFNRGETFDWPEVVPFRLTHNMVGAMGPMGYEGVFRQACEVTMRVMKNEKDPLMSVLKTFIYDPLVEWSKQPKGKSPETGEIKNEKAQHHVQAIESRLEGIIKVGMRRGRNMLPLSVEGHVNHVIQEATNPKNLSKMYVGWAAYL
ncbi:serine/threonine-protein kinase ATR-like [Lineus longissimus]|uniref:serine/threonine-protein kinase ATR-like n=1 Tax=Lineus longissimus TaxID=88925 RepID=UPI00315C78AC